MTVMEHVHQNQDLAMENVCRDMLNAVNIALLQRFMTDIIMNVMEHAPKSGEKAVMENVMRDMLNAMDIATLKSIMTHIIMTAMELALERGENPAMESVMRDMLNAVDIATAKIIMTVTNGIVMENVSVGTNNAMAPAPMKAPRVETICASVVMMIPTARPPAQTTGSVTAPVYSSKVLVIRTAPLGSITAITPTPTPMTPTAMKDVSTKTPFLNSSNTAMTVSSVSGPMRNVLLKKTSAVQRRTLPPCLHQQ